MDLSAHTTFHFPRDTVYRTYRDRLPELTPYLPNVASIEEKERRVEGARTRVLNLWTARADIPAVAQRFLKPDMLRWLDHADWDEDAWSCRWRMEFPALPGVVECGGENAWKAAGSGTELEIRGTLVLHLERMGLPRLVVPSVRPVVERIIVAALKPNLVSTGAGVERFLQAQPAGGATT